MFDLPYILTHPLLAQIIRRCAELKEQAGPLPENSKERKTLEKRISQLEPYALPMPTPSERQVFPITNPQGQVVGERSSLRRRFRATRRGHPEEYRIAVRAAFEDKLTHPGLTYRHLSEKYRFENRDVLRRAVRRLREVLRAEDIADPQPSDYLAAQ